MGVTSLLDNAQGITDSRLGVCKTVRQLFLAEAGGRLVSPTETVPMLPKPLADQFACELTGRRQFSSRQATFVSALARFCNATQ